MLNEIIHGDCLQVMRNMRDGSVNMILTDIPYGTVTRHGAERAKYGNQLRKIDKGTADIVTFDTLDFAKECARISSGTIYVFCSLKQASDLYDFFLDHGDFMTRQCVWTKTNPSPSNGQHMWLSSIEHCIFAKRRKTKFNAYCKKANWEFPVGRSKVHPTEKPLKLFEYLLESSTDKKDIVLDPCIGSGTTAIASLNTGRYFIGIEKEEQYHKIACERVKKWHEENEEGTYAN